MIEMAKRGAKTRGGPWWICETRYRIGYDIYGPTPQQEFRRSQKLRFAGKAEKGTRSLSPTIGSAFHMLAPAIFIGRVFRDFVRHQLATCPLADADLPAQLRNLLNIAENRTHH